MLLTQLTQRYLFYTLTAASLMLPLLSLPLVTNVISHRLNNPNFPCSANLPTSIVFSLTLTHSPLCLHGLALSVVEGQDEVEEVGFPQVRRRLLLKVSPGQTHPAATKDAELDG